MNSMKIGTYQMDTTFGLYLPEYTIPAPAVQTNFVKIIGRDGSVDLSNALGLHYDSRTWSLDFKCFDPTVNWHTLSSQVMNAIHGKRLNFEFDDDPNYFWTGRVSVQNYVSNHGTGTLKVTIVSDPFKYAKLSTIVTKTASTGTDYTGALVTFNTANAKINDLFVTMQPIQDLHGYDSPWPAGGGKNLFQTTATSKTESGVTWTVNEDGSITATGTATGATTILAGAASVDASMGNVAISLDGLSVETNIAVNYVRLYDANGNQLSTIIPGGLSYIQAVFDLSQYADAAEIRVSLKRNNNVATNGTVHIQVEKGTSYTDWTPYSNICPISGRTGLNVYRTGKNMCVPDLANGQIGSNGGYSSNTSRLTNAVRVDNAYVSNTYLSAGTYTLSADGLTQCTVLTKDASANIIDNFATAWHNLPYTFTMTAAGYVFFTVKKSSGDLNPDDYKAQIESGSSATAYEPYNGNTYSVDWTSEAGTVYHGTVDPVTGQLTVDWASVDMGSLSWSRNATYNVMYAYVTGKASGRGNIICSNYKTVELYYEYLSSGEISGALNNNAINVKDDAYTSAADFKTAMNGVQLVYELATPLTYQLTPQEVEALVGTNNVWSDVGNVTVAVVTPETLTNNGRAVVPTLTASADMVLKWGNYSASVQQGTSTIPQLILENGANLIYIIGTGSISFTWQEASL